MQLSFEELTEQAMKLSDDQKSELVHRLIDGMTPEDEGDELTPEEHAAVEKAWAEEIERRMDRMESGEDKGIPAEEVFRRLEAKYSR